MYRSCNCLNSTHSLPFFMAIDLFFFSFFFPSQPGSVCLNVLYDLKYYHRMHSVQELKFSLILNSRRNWLALPTFSTHEHRRSNFNVPTNKIKEKINRQAIFFFVATIYRTCITLTMSAFKLFQSMYKYWRIENNLECGSLKRWMKIPPKILMRGFCQRVAVMYKPAHVYQFIYKYTFIYHTRARERELSLHHHDVDVYIYI